MPDPLATNTHKRIAFVALAIRILLLACTSCAGGDALGGSGTSATSRDGGSSDGTGDGTGDAPVTIVLTSPAFEDGAQIPQEFTEDGADVSPPLAWSSAPADTVELALIVDDPDAPTPQPWVHWVLYNIPATATSLPQSIPTTASVSNPAGAVQGMNSWGRTGYGGPAPPSDSGTHHYFFKLFALDTALESAAGLTKEELLAVIEGHVIARGELVATYNR